MTEQGRPLDLDAALSRLEDVLLALPLDRPLPDLDQLLQAASLPHELLQRDERVLKVLHEAVLARPYSDPEDVARVRTEVELLTLESEVLAARFTDTTASDEELSRAVGRLREVRRRLEELRDQL